MIAGPCSVEDRGQIMEIAHAVKEAGGTEVTARMPVGDMGFTGYFTDTEGNLIGLWETAR